MSMVLHPIVRSVVAIYECQKQNMLICCVSRSRKHKRIMHHRMASPGSRIMADAKKANGICVVDVIVVASPLAPLSPIENNNKTELMSFFRRVCVRCRLANANYMCTSYNIPCAPTIYCAVYGPRTVSAPISDATIFGGIRSGGRATVPSARHTPQRLTRVVIG